MLVLVVGPSGAGKDTLLGLARAALADNPRIRFVRRVITRPDDAGGEDHEAISEAEFAARSFALQWQAHGLHYGIPDDLTDDLAAGSAVVANVSRGVIAHAAERYPTSVIEITAPPHILAQRLAARGRETDDDVAKRLSRSVSIPPHIAIETIINDKTLAEAADHFISALIRAAEPVPPEQTPHPAMPA
jgi:phosphonate metabolism protein PhnN/1,5-bisphosphokinase (PRPP-forming)